MPRLSVILPTLNEEKLVEHALRQFTPDLLRRYDVELIVSDGGSSDRTLEIARRYAHMVVENQAGIRQTISIGRNAGAAQASGEILVFLNADTYLKDPGWFFQRLTDEMKAEEVLALTCSVLVDPQEERLSDRLFHGFYNRFFSLMNVVGMGMGRGECHIIRRATFERLGGYAAGIAAGEDYDLYRRVAHEGRIRFMHDVVVFESPRRYRRYGYLMVTASWFLNFLSVFFLHRSILREWKAIR